ncbi:MAG: fasciclin domain-containing protein, partial [Planctomycetota bacterium]
LPDLRRTLAGENVARAKREALEADRARRAEQAEALLRRLGEASDVSRSNIAGEGQPTVAERLRSDPEVRGFAALMEKRGMMEQFEGGMTATVFVPKPAHLPSDTKAAAYDARLRGLLPYHIIYGELTDDFFARGFSPVTQRKRAGELLEVGLSVDESGQKRVNGLPILRTIAASNGRIYVVDGVLDPEAGPTPRAASIKSR